MNRMPRRAMVRISLLLFAVVADRPTRRADAGRERRIRNDPASPNRGDEIVPGDDPVAILHEVDEQIEDLRFDCNRRSAAEQLPRSDVKYVISKKKLHLCSPSGDAASSIYQEHLTQIIAAQSLVIMLGYLWADWCGAHPSDGGLQAMPSVSSGGLAGAEVSMSFGVNSIQNMTRRN